MSTWDPRVGGSGNRPDPLLPDRAPAPHDRAGALRDGTAEIGECVAGPAADDVDRQGRFPREALGSLRSRGLLSALVPAQYGGADASTTDIVEATVNLSRHCAATGLIFAMHHIQVACLVRHGCPTDYLAELVDRQLLLASATSEERVGGDLGTSRCAVEPVVDGLRLEKRASTVSYGAHADAVLVTARRKPDSPATDQVLVLCRPPHLLREPTSTWNALGFRGTCSPSFRLVAEGGDHLVLPEPFRMIAAETMVPMSHLLWSAVWLGIASAAVDRARRFVRDLVRKERAPESAAALRMAELVALFQQMSYLVRTAAERYESNAANREWCSSTGVAIGMNSLKVSASSLVVAIVGRAMRICGIHGYSEESPYSLGRQLRDAYGAVLMVNNDRILSNNAQLLLTYRDEPW